MSRLIEALENEVRSQVQEENAYPDYSDHSDHSDDGGWGDGWNDGPSHSDSWADTGWPRK